MSEPSILQLVYDSVREIRQATSDIAEEQSTQGRRIEAVLGQMATATMRLDQADRVIAKLEGRVADIEQRVQDLRRVAWILTIVGGMLVAVVTSVASDWAGRMLDPPSRPVNAAAAQLTHQGE